MNIKWIKLSILAIAIMVTLITGFTFFSREIPLLAHCKSNLSFLIKTPEDIISTTGELHLFIEDQKTFFIAIDGSLNVNGERYKINRHLYYSYTHKTADFTYDIKSKFIHADKFHTDNAPDEIVNTRLFGTPQKDGALYTLKWIDKSTVIIGNYFTPYYICQKDN